MKYFFTILIVVTSSFLIAQSKKAITHDVYDKWESIGERSVNRNGTYVLYAVNPQEGDGNLYITNVNGKNIKTIPRGYGASFSYDGNFVFGKIKPKFKDSREARIKKKRPDEMPKDTFFIYDVLTDSLWKKDKVKSFKMPEKASGYIAYLLDKADAPKPVSTTKVIPDSLTQIQQVLRMADSLRNIADSLVKKTKQVKKEGLQVLAPPKKVEPKPTTPEKKEDPIEEGTDLVLRNLVSGKETIFKLTNEYYFNKYGQILVVESSKKNGDSIRKAMVVKHTLATSVTDTILKGFNDAKNYAIDEAGTQVAFVIERDSVTKALQKFYKLAYYNASVPTEAVVYDKQHTAVPLGYSISPDYNNAFSEDGKKLFFGIAPIRKPKDTTLVDFETARLDVWHYNDDFLQPMQQVQLQQELRRSQTMVLHPNKNSIIRVATDTTENTELLNEGNANYVLATSSFGKRKEIQWQGFSLQNAYIVNTDNGNTTKIFSNKRAYESASPKGKYIVWYDLDAKQYFSYNIANGKTTNFTQSIKVPLYDEDDDHPDAPNPHGSMGWSEDDAFVYIYDKYDIWKCDPEAKIAPLKITNGRAKKIITRYQRTNREERFLPNGTLQLFTFFSEETKKTNFEYLKDYNTIDVKEPELTSTLRSYTAAIDNKHTVIYTSESPNQSPSLVAYTHNANQPDASQVKVLHRPNAQQADYNWYTTELVRWKMFDGKMSEGILYKPEDFDPKKKYPIIFYFYERDADDLYNYRSPAPSASTVNIPYFTSNGYLVFDPNIYYKNGEPGESAYNSVVSAAKHLTKTNKWVDSTKMAIQGQSWGGYQVAYLVTRTNIFAAAGAGAPVANMTSAYGGIRWGSGMNRQFQYERSQSRLGATLWQKRDLYIKNSPLFFADKVQTPLLMMHNDKDGAVPWYQGIEYFTALRRLNKKVWMLQYNDEDHNLIERRNRKDLSIRLGQFFDHYLKNKPMPVWMSKGVPAAVKGIDWGLDIK
jgi:dipeptidyl aminopeptidase/acylaminoacyl peptidase